jgi:hypothetical protein
MEVLTSGNNPQARNLGFDHERIFLEMEGV